MYKWYIRTTLTCVCRQLTLSWKILEKCYPSYILTNVWCTYGNFSCIGASKMPNKCRWWCKQPETDITLTVPDKGMTNQSASRTPPSPNCRYIVLNKKELCFDLFLLYVHEDTALSKHSALNSVVNILQTTFWMRFEWKDYFDSDFADFFWMIQFTIIRQFVWWCSLLTRRQAITWTDDDQVL